MASTWRDKLTGGAGSGAGTQSLGEHSMWWARTFGAALAVVSVLMCIFTPHSIGDHKYRLLLWTAIPYILITFSWPLITAKYTRQKERLLIGSVLLIIAFISTVLISSHMSCWCCKREGDMVDMCKMSLAATKVLEKHNIDYWICFGTLLGAVRESDMPFQSMAWEHDFDLCVLQKDWDKIEEIWAEELHGYIHPPGSTQLYDPNFRAVISRSYMDLYRFRENGDTLETNDGVKEGQTLSIPRSNVYPLQRTTVCEFSFLSPSRPLENLAAVFGGNWRTPMWPPGLQNAACKLWVDCDLKRIPE